MNALARNTILTLVALFALAAGYLLNRGQFDSAQDAQAVEELFALSLEDGGGRAQAMKQWQGKLLVVNFWATWCPPCLEEMPGFSRLQNKLAANGVQFVGIGIDSPEKIRQFTSVTPSAYPLLIGAPGTFAVARKLGDRSDSLPFTLVIDTKGEVRAAKLGLWNETELESFLAKIPR